MALGRFFDKVVMAARGQLSVDAATMKAALEGVTITVVVGPAARSGNDWWIAELTVNLLARLYPRLVIQAANPADRAELEGLALSINPKLELSETADGIVVAIGTDAGPGSIRPWAAGWVAHLGGTRPPGTVLDNPYAAGFASALAVSEVFRRVFAARIPDQREMDNVSVSLLDYGRSAGSDLELPRVDLTGTVLAGVGAVGSAAAWALARHEGLHGEIWGVDPETADVSNLQRYVLFEDGDVDSCKVEVLARELEGTAVSVRKYRGTLEGFADDHLVPACGTVICVSADSVQVRRTAQALLPKLLVNGWTGDASLGASWHEFDSGSACGACMYHPHGPILGPADHVARSFGVDKKRAADLWMKNQALTRAEAIAAAGRLGQNASVVEQWTVVPIRKLYSEVVCGMVGLDLHGVGEVHAVPLAHQSMMAGILMAAELVKRLDPELRFRSNADSLVIWGDVLRPLPVLLTQPRGMEPGCICSDPVYQAVYAKKWRDYPAIANVVRTA